jgi:thiol-disulfide isomerase/thioredoxin
LRGKYVILDFWHSKCSSCIHAFPKMQKLQGKYKGQIKVILVNYETKQQVLNFLARSKKITGMTVNLPIACGDLKLTGYFKPVEYPHYVWIDQNGIMRYASYGSGVTSENIEAVLHNKSIDIVEKRDEDPDYKFGEPLLLNNNGGNGSTIRCYSMLSKYIKNLPSFGEVDNAGDSISHISAFNLPIEMMFRKAFNDYVNGFWLPQNRTILQVKDTSKYVFYKNGVIKWSNLYIYQLWFPYQSRESLEKMMQQDLMRYFGLDAHMEKRMMKCWVMTAEDTSLLVTKGGNSQNDIIAEDYSMIVRNVPDSELALRFIYNILELSPYPVVNEIHMKSNADIILENINFDNQDDVIQAMKKKYKVNFKLEDHLVNILIISEPGYQSGINTGEKKSLEYDHIGQPGGG